LARVGPRAPALGAASLWKRIWPQAQRTRLTLPKTLTDRPHRAQVKISMAVRTG
jgi:hypothetical protein